MNVRAEIEKRNCLVKASVFSALIFLLFGHNKYYSYNKEDAEIWQQESDFYEKTLLLKEQIDDGRVKRGSIGHRIWLEYQLRKTRGEQ